MNFYKHHLGDYAQATGHLSFVEDAAYSRLIRKYYAEERPIPGELKSAQRLVGARTKEEREAVETVLAEFFDLREDGWHNKRCDEEIAQANAQAETNRRIAEQREAKKRERREHESLHGASHDQSTNRAPESMGEREPSQTPDSRHQTPEEEKSASALSAHATPAGDACKAMKEAAGLQAVNPSDPRLIALLAAGITVEELINAARTAVQGGKGFAYALATAEGRRRDAAAITPLPSARAKPNGGYAAERNRAFAGEFADDAHLTIDEERSHDIAIPGPRG